MEPAHQPDKPTEPPPSPERQQALLTLLADEDAAVSDAIRERLLAGGATTMAWLSRHRAHPDAEIRRRVRALLLQDGRSRADVEFLNFCNRQAEHFDLEDACWMLARTRNPDAPVEAYRAQLDGWAEQARPAVELAPDGVGVAAALSHVLFVEHGFRGNTEDYYDPLNSYLDAVMDRRRGIPITLCALYQFTARRLGLPVTGIGMPGHFLCRYQTVHEELFLDPFHGGVVVSRAEARRRLSHFSLDDLDSHLQPLSARRCLQRMISNLQVIHRERKDTEDSLRLERYLMLLSR
jgi:regulator of sirC expression with transglutaminase-like and TPR domain